MRTLEEYLQPLDEANGLAPNEWLADMERMSNKEPTK